MTTNGKQQKAEHIRRLIVNIVTRSGHDVKVSLPSLLREAIQDQLWKQLRKADGTKYEDAVDWLEDGLPNGCMVGLDRAYFSRDELTAIIKDLGESNTTHSVLKALQAPGRRQNGKRARQRNDEPVDVKSKTRSNLAVLLQREFPKHWQGYLDGAYKSLHAAAVAAGIKKDGHDPLQRMKSYWRRATPAQQRAFKAWLRTKESKQ